MKHRMTSEEVMDFLKIGRATLYKRVRDGRLHPEREGRRLLFDPLEVEHSIKPVRDPAKVKEVLDRMMKGLIQGPLPFQGPLRKEIYRG